MDELIAAVRGKLGQLAEAKGDAILCNGGRYPVLPNGFSFFEGVHDMPAPTAFIDGGNATLFAAPGMEVAFVRVFGCVFAGKKRIKEVKHEFFLLSNVHDEVAYVSAFGEGLFAEKLFSFPVADIENGELASSLVRRMAEVKMARQLQQHADFVVLDGTLEPMHALEEKELSALDKNVAAFAKTNSMLTQQGNTASSALHRLQPDTAWHYFLTADGERDISFVKLHKKSNYVFQLETMKKMEGNGLAGLLQILCIHGSDAVFPGYPYGLLYADQRARVSNEEKELLRMQLLAKLGASANTLLQLGRTSDAHAVLDKVKF